LDIGSLKWNKREKKNALKNSLKRENQISFWVNLIENEQILIFLNFTFIEN
jgi:hypothetical protein